MRIVILGGDGYLGWPTAMTLAAHGHDVWIMDNYLRRRLAAETHSEALFETPRMEARVARFAALSGKIIRQRTGDCTNYEELAALLRDARPEAVIHYAEQPSGPYSMIGRVEATLTLDNNLQSTLNLVWAVMEYAPACHIVKLGTMGEYGTPNIDIEEGWLAVDHKGRHEKFLYPRAAGTLYHTTKVLDTDLLWFYVRVYGLSVTDLMQGPVYGLVTAESALDDALLPHFHYDDIFGTVLNRFIVQAVAGIPLTVYGRGGQTRGYLNITDTVQCIELAIARPAAPGELRILNQFTETFSVNDLAEHVRAAAQLLQIDVRIEHIPNPRIEKEDHYYNPAHSGLAELGLKAHLLTPDVICSILTKVRHHADRIDRSKVLPRVNWRSR